MNKILNFKIKLNCSPDKAFEFFTQNDKITKWLTTEAKIEPEVGGKYELFWNPENHEIDSTIGCRITAVEPGKLIAFEWKGAKEFKEIMNDVDPLTHVSVSFIPVDGGTEVHMLHTGWRATPDWEEARVWFGRAWSGCFPVLQKLVEG